MYSYVYFSSFDCTQDWRIFLPLTYDAIDIVYGLLQGISVNALPEPHTELGICLTVAVTW